MAKILELEVEPEDVTEIPVIMIKLKTLVDE